MDASASLSRRGFLAATSGAAAAGAAGVAAAQEETEGETPTEGGGNGTETPGGDGTEGGNGTEGGEDGGEEDGGEGGGGGGEGVPDFGSYLQGANGYSEGDVADERGSDEVTIMVGAGGDGYTFDPPAVWIDPGTTVVWEWTGEGGGHNVVTEEGEADLSSDRVSDEGHTYEHEFTEEESGITTYKCEPHEGNGMKGGVAVGDDVPTIDPGGGSEASVEIPGQAMALSLATAMAMGTTLALGYVFMRWGGDTAAAEE